MTDLMQLGQQAKDSAQQLALMPTNRKNELLVQMAQTIKKNQQAIIEANHKDLEKQSKTISVKRCKTACS